MHMQDLVDWARREPWLALAALVMVDLAATLILELARSTGRLRSLAVILVATVVVAVALDRLYPPRDRIVEPPPVKITPGPRPETSPPTAAELASLLEKRRDEKEIRTVFHALGTEKDYPDQRGSICCFKQHGLEFLFDDRGQLNTICFFSGISDHHQHAAYAGSLPAGLQFVMDRTQAQEQIDKDQGIHVEPEPGRNDWIKYVLRDESRLYIHYGAFDGAERILEIELFKRENLLEQHAALAR